MCGICGYLGPRLEGCLDRMLGAIEHRGPDAEGRFESPEAHLGNRRLSIIDLEGGDQPVWNEDRSVALVYNGEIYNYRELRSELEARGHGFYTKTDTEVIVHLYEEAGAECARTLNGMFGFALWDTRRRRLLLVRDPVGIKPLFYFWNGRELVFGSEIKCLLAHPAVTAKLDATALHDLLNVRFVPGHRTLFDGVQELPPGHSLVLEAGGSPRVSAYHEWQLEEGSDISPHEAAEQFLDTLEAAVQRQMVADVPVGLYLSGGLDSSAILAAAAKTRPADRISTFTLGFNEPTDENEDAALVARHIGSDHREMSLNASPLALLPRIVYHTEMPKVNSPQGYYLSRFARQHVKVALSGLGGDELFFGYELYRYLWPGKVLIDGPLSPVLGLGAPIVDLLAHIFDRVAGLRGENARRGLELAASGDDPLRYYLTLRNGWDLGAATPPKIYNEPWRRKLGYSTRDSFESLFDARERPFAEQVQWAELRGKMVDDFLLNEDRMSMASSLEVRVPFLDLEMVRFALSLPLRIKHERRELKPVMKRALGAELPMEILRKRKWGFTFDPYEQFRKDLRHLAASELTDDFLEEQGIFNRHFVRRIIEHPPTKKLHWHYFLLWQILGFKLWQEIFLQGRDWRELESRLEASTREAA